MSRCLDQKALFALLDRPRSGGERDDEANHIAGCADCREALARLEATREAAARCLEPGKPDWAGIDRAIEGAIRDLTTEPGGGSAWIPAVLSTAAAALIAFAFIHTAGEPTQPTRVGNLPIDPTSYSPPRVLPPVLATVVTDAVGDSPRVMKDATRIEAGTTVEPGPDGSVRASLGQIATLEAREGARLAIHSVNVDTYTLQLMEGEMLLDAPPGSMERDLIVLAGGEIFGVFCGSASFNSAPDGLVVTIFEGEVFALSGDPRSLGPGTTWKLSVSAAGVEPGAPEWIPLETTALPEAGGMDMDLAGPSERDASSRGTLPIKIVRDILDDNKPGLTACYETSLKRFPSLRDEISVTARIGVTSTGKVSRVRIKGAGDWPQLEACLRGVLVGMDFPPPDGGPLELILPLRLSPRR